jgi:penicillin-binding protein 1A
LIRALIGNLTQPRRLQGGSTITQQVVKNLLVGDEVSYERKIREMIVAARLESALSKDAILELYLNSVYLGRSAWGIEMAARGYFGKTARQLSVAEGALLAGVTKGPTYFSPDRRPALARERLAYVLNRMREDGMLDAAVRDEDSGAGSPPLPTLVALDRPRRDIGFHFVDQVAREARSEAGIDRITDASYTVHSTIDPPLQRAVEESLQEGLSRYERDNGRAQFAGAEANLAAAIVKIDDRKNTSAQPSWQQALVNARLPLYDVHWTPAVLVQRPGGRKGDASRVGLADGHVVPLVADGAAQRKFSLYDVVFVHLVEGKSKVPVRAELRVRPAVQGLIVVLENKTGRILAMSGGFSYPLRGRNGSARSLASRNRFPAGVGGAEQRPVRLSTETGSSMQ